jgi:hypothetical protein
MASTKVAHELATLAAMARNADHNLRHARQWLADGDRQAAALAMALADTELATFRVRLRAVMDAFGPEMATKAVSDEVQAASRKLAAAKKETAPQK